MCIRDRLTVVCIYILIPIFAQHFSSYLPDKGVLKFILYEICLLYTSDAADERSSVDLGGRRIIKKKKTYIQRSGLHNM